MGELKPDPCRFCGSDAVVVSDGQASFMVGCTNPACGICNAARDFTSEAEAIAAWNTRPPTEGRGDEPVAWRVKDFADGWILFHTEAAARREAEGAGNLVQPLYASRIRAGLGQEGGQ